MKITKNKPLILEAADREHLEIKNLRGDNLHCPQIQLDWDRILPGCALALSAERTIYIGAIEITSEGETEVEIIEIINV